MPGWSRVLGQSDLFLCHFYIIITCYDRNNVSVITYFNIVIMSLLHINMPVITSLLPVFTVKFTIITSYYSNNNGCMTNYWPTQLADAIVVLFLKPSNASSTAAATVRPSLPHQQVFLFTISRKLQGPMRTTVTTQQALMWSMRLLFVQLLPWHLHLLARVAMLSLYFP